MDCLETYTGTPFVSHHTQGHPSSSSLRKPAEKRDTSATKIAILGCTPLAQLGQTRLYLPDVCDDIFLTEHITLHVACICTPIGRPDQSK